MKYKVLMVIFLLGILQCGYSQEQRHFIQLTVDLKPYVNARDIEAQIFVNHEYRASLRADNSAFARIVGQVPKREKDSLIEIQIVINSPMHYIAVEKQMPFLYTPGIGRRVIVASKPWLKEHGLSYAKQLAKISPDTSLNFTATLLNENLFNNISEEVELTKLLADNYAAIGDYSLGYKSIASLSNNKIKSLTLSQRKNYYADLFDKFYLTIVDTASKYRRRSEIIANLAETIFKNDTTYQSWTLVTNKILAVPLGNEINIELFKNTSNTLYTLKSQVSELTYKLNGLNFKLNPIPED